MNHVKSWAIAITLAIIIGAVYEFYISPKLSFTSPIGHLVKYDNINYAPPGKVEIYLITWYGCPMSAGLSWSLYLALKNYGNVIVEPHSSLMIGTPSGAFSSVLPTDSAVPGLLLLNFTSNNGKIIFKEVMVYNEELNETTTGYFIRNYTSPYDSKPPVEAVNLGLKTLEQLAPSWVYQIVYKTQIEEKLFPFGNGSVAFAAHHLVSELIITGPKGTWIALFYISPESPAVVVADSGYSHMNIQQAKDVASIMLSQINSGNVPSNIEQAANEIESIISLELS